MLRIKRLKWKTRRNRKAMLKKAAVVAPVAILIVLVLIGLIALVGSLFKADTSTKKPAASKKPAAKKTVKPVAKKPSLVIVEPPTGFITDQSSVIVRGRTDPDCDLTLNGIEVPVNSDGSFNFFLSLVYGMNTCRITVTNKSGQVTEQEISIDCTRPPKAAGNS